MENKEITDATPKTVRTPSADAEDDVITTSTESETFGTWTLVTDKNKKQQIIIGTPAPVAVSASENTKHTKTAGERVEELQQDETHEADEMEPEDTELKTNNDSPLDDLSDGISIISESESGGRFSPHPYLRHHLQDLNLKYRAGDEYETTPLVLPSSSEPTLADFQIKKRRRKRSASISHCDLVDSSLQPTEVDDAAVTQPMTFHPIIRTGLTGVFYVGVLLGVLAFIGRLRYPEWEPLNTSKPIEQLEQKLTDMELQNNLMRAEIDILSKQVNYLTNLRDNQQQRGSGVRDQKPYKAWSGNEAPPPLQQEPISKELRKPYKCPNGKYVANADFCIEAVATNEKPLNIEINTADDEDDTLKEFEKVVEQMNKFGSNIFKNFESVETSDENVATASAQKGEKKYDRKMTEKFNKDYSAKYDSKSDEKQQKTYQHAPDSKESDERQGKKYNDRRIHSKEHDDDDDDDHSDERFKKHRNAIFSNERNSKERNSKERFNKHRGQHNSKERYQNNDKDGHWHEKLMHHREQERQRNSERQNNDKNWYINRGNSREQIRHGEKEKRFR